MVKSVVADWYSGQYVFVTGATGFMGKILVEKILRSCPKIAALYILVRSKKGKLARHRLDDFLSCPVFDRIRDQPNSEEIFQKLQCISGDITEKGCGLSDKDEALLSNTVSVTFHMAANVRFNQELKGAVLMNTSGTMNVLDLACGFKNLKAFVHVSTSYCHCDETVVEERTYKSPHSPRKILEVVNWMNDELLEVLTPKLLKNSPNTYAYTKCLTEQLISEYSDKLPIAITRPSIVTAAYRDPIPGWIDNLNGPTGIIVGGGKGVIRTMLCDENLGADIMPVDMCINSLLLVAWKLGSEPRKSETEVYNVVANKEDLFTWGQALDLGQKHLAKYPFSVCLWYPGGSARSSYFVHIIAVLLFHLIPAYFIDFLMVLTRNKPFLVRTQQRIQCGLGLLEYYTTRPWVFPNDKLNKIMKELSKTDREIFFTASSEPIIADEYMLNYILGARKYCIGEGMETLPYARKMHKRLYYLDVLKNIIIFGLMIWLFFICATKLLHAIHDPFELMIKTYQPQQYVPVKNV